MVALGLILNSVSFSPENKVEAMEKERRWGNHKWLFKIYDVLSPNFHECNKVDSQRVQAFGCRVILKYWLFILYKRMRKIDHIHKLLGTSLLGGHQSTHYSYLGVKFYPARHACTCLVVCYIPQEFFKSHLTTSWKYICNSPWGILYTSKKKDHKCWHFIDLNASRVFGFSQHLIPLPILVECIETSQQLPSIFL